MTNTELKERISEVVADQETLDEIIVLEGDEFADGAVGLTHDYHIVYDYEKLTESLMKHNGWTEEEAIDWLDYNTLGSLAYMASQGNAPIIIMNNFSDFS